jgi:hypothetical protein
MPARDNSANPINCIAFAGAGEMSAKIENRKLPGSPGSQALVLALVILAHAVGIWAWMKYGGLNKTPALPPMMVIMDPPPKPRAPEQPARGDTAKPADHTTHYWPAR